MQFLAVCLGGAIGSGARFLLSSWVLRLTGPAFPYGTLAVNAIGSFLLALAMYASIEASFVSPTLRLAVTTGVLGGFTTYSTFSYETMRYVQDGAWLLAGLNIAVTISLCLVACLLGWASGRLLFGP